MSIKKVRSTDDLSDCSETKNAHAFAASNDQTHKERQTEIGQRIHVNKHRQKLRLDSFDIKEVEALFFFLRSFFCVLFFLSFFTRLRCAIYR